MSQAPIAPQPLSGPNCTLPFLPTFCPPGSHFDLYLAPSPGEAGGPSLCPPPPHLLDEAPRGPSGELLGAGGWKG